MDRVNDLGGFNKLVQGRDGVFLANENDLYVGRAMIKYGEYSYFELDLLRQIVQPNDIFADIGANIGGLTVPLATSVGPQGRGLAFEMQPVVFQNLCANLSLNALTNVDAFHCGLGDEQTDVQIPMYRYDQPFNYAGIPIQRQEERGVSLAIKRFDDVFQYPRLKLIKIDVEGMEAEVIRGARQSIQKYRPVLYVENDREDRSHELIELVMSLDYRLWWHTPPLFNPQNYFGDDENVFPNLASLNMLCFHRDVPVNLPQLTEITEPTVHPSFEKM